MKIKELFLILLITTISGTVSAQKYASKSNSEVKTSWEGAAFSSNLTIKENIAEVPSFSILNEILNDTAITTALGNKEMVTVFLPLDEAFLKLSKKERKALLADKKTLEATMKLFAVPGRLDSHSIKKAIEKNNGLAHFSTLSGELLGAKIVKGDIVLFDSENNMATLKATDFYHKNGFFHIVDGLVYTASTSK
ncbi:fasciclin domain-containing protein [Ulvibacter antarcticus]|nr:fasciclin domain-containing protein [Ulvibacter antarcticus]